ncbi:MAG TPA: hypothetical protein VFA43_03030 [Gemmatimonadaceae bacterium]|nr:hypothetical protein [Gemmatimonadaceae bacterium]
MKYDFPRIGIDSHACPTDRLSEIIYAKRASAVIRVAADALGYQLAQVHSPGRSGPDVPAIRMHEVASGDGVTACDLTTTIDRSCS